MTNLLQITIYVYKYDTRQFLWEVVNLIELMHNMNSCKIRFDKS